MGRYQTKYRSRKRRQRRTRKNGRHVNRTRKIRQQGGKAVKIFNLDLHQSVIEDIKNIMNTLYGPKVELTAWSISAHNHQFKKPDADVKHITQGTWKSIDTAMIKRFQDEYDEFLKGFDAFIVTFSPVFAMLYEKYGKPIIIINATRYDQPFCWNKNTEMLNLFHDSLKRMESSKQMIMVSNNLADQKYLKDRGKIDSIYIPSLCLYTNAHYKNPSKDEFMMFGGGINDKLKSVAHSEKLVNRPENYDFPDLAEYKGIIHMPYDISAMAMFEQYFAGIPLFFPEKEFYKKCIQEGTKFIALYDAWDRKPTNEELDMWLANADYYNFKHINYYTSFEDCVDKINKFVDTDKDARLGWIAEVKHKAKNDWKQLLDPIIIGSHKIKESKYISTRGIRHYCDVFNKPPGKDGDLVFIHCDRLKEFAGYMKDNTYRYILVSGDGDLTFPENLGMDYRAFLGNEKLIHMFVNNSSVSHEKLTLLPLGINYHTMNEGGNKWGPQVDPASQDAELAALQGSLKPLKERLRKCYGNFHFNKQEGGPYGNDRRDAIAKIPRELIDYEEKFIPRTETWKKQGEYAFVVAPHGHGLDCHRQWEALCLGCIPIVKTSSIDIEYENLPVLIVKEWSDITQALLDSTVEDFSKKEFEMDRLLLSYWVNKINSYKK